FGEYVVSEQMQNGWEQTFPPPPGTHTVEIVSGTNAEKIFGNRLSTGVIQLSEVPVDFILYQNVPNPFNPSTTIQFDVPKESFVSLKLYNLLGQEMEKSIDQQLSAGKYRVTINANVLQSGIYFYRLVASKDGAILYSSMKKMVVLK
ncbi:MAG: T9SS type A sorting domain-containing protein, partial [Ignavibacteriales bacterium]|nr:T9SS type A sorting domain-containing protein [Ignavibacteriales bacterium]